MESNIEKAINDIKLDTVEDRIETAQKLNSALSMDQFSATLDAWASRFTPEYMEELSHKCYEDDRNYPENFSNWLQIFSFLILILCLSAFVLAYLKQNDLIGIINVREGSIFGAAIGFVAFIAFSIVFIPISSIIGLIFKSYPLDVLGFFMNDFGSFIVLILLIISTAGLAALFNGFTGLITAYIYELINGVKKEANENNTVDFTIE